MNISEALLSFSLKTGCDVAFCLTGGMAMHINRALSLSSEIKTVFVHHETAALAAADGYSKSHNLTRPGLAVITSGPAVTNCMTGLASAFGDSVPLVVIAGQVKRSDINIHGVRSHGIQEVDQLGIVSHITSFSARVDESNLSEVLQEAWYHLTTGRRGPVFLEVPLDVQSLQAPELSLRLPAPVAENSGALPCLDYSNYKRPVVLIGNGARSGLSTKPALLPELNRRKIPRVYTWASFDLEPGSSEGNLGCPGSLAPIHANRILCESDLFISIGARLDLATTAFDPVDFASQATRIIVDIDECELNKFHNNFDAYRVLGDATSALEGLIAAGVSGTADWYAHCSEQKHQSLSDEHDRLQSDALTVREIAVLTSRYATNRVIVPASSGIAEETFTRFFVPQQGTVFFNGAALGSMGLGLSHGIGAASGNSRDGVWIFEGDGGLLMNVQELATLRQNHPCGVALFVLNNSGYASISNSQRRLFDYEFGATSHSGISFPNWSILSEAFGLPYQRISHKADLESLMACWHSKTPTTLFDLSIPSSEPRGPQLVTQIRDGIPYTPKIGELAWP